MAVPKRRHSKARARWRRSHDALPKKSLARCPRCNQALEPHTVCSNCGYYRGKRIVAIEGAE